MNTSYFIQKSEWNSTIMNMYPYLDSVVSTVPGQQSHDIIFIKKFNYDKISVTVQYVFRFQFTQTHGHAVSTSPQRAQTRSPRGILRYGK